METIEIGGQKYVLVPEAEYEILTDEKVGTRFVADYLGVTQVTAWRNKWNYPDFGKALEGRRGSNIKPYSRKEMENWLRIPDRIRKKKYMEAMNEAK